MNVAYAYRPTWDDLLATWRELDVPEGCRPELTIEGIVMTPAPAGAHNMIASRVHRVLDRCLPESMGIYETQGVGIEGADAIYIPDICVAPYAATPPGPDPIPAERVLLAVEVTSPSNGDNDRFNKIRAYALGRIPQFLLIDPHHENGPTCLLMSTPLSTGIYSSTIAVPFGEPVKLGEPFDVELDTSRF